MIDKKIVIIAFVAALLTGCGETGTLPQTLQDSGQTIGGGEGGTQLPKDNTKIAVTTNGDNDQTPDTADKDPYLDTADSDQTGTTGDTAEDNGQVPDSSNEDTDPDTGGDEQTGTEGDNDQTPDSSNEDTDQNTAGEGETQTGIRYTKLSDTLYINDKKDVVVYIDQDLNKSAKLIYDTAKVREITQRLYSKFDDAFDFIFLVTNNKERPKSVTYAGVFSKIKNDVEGIGAPLYDNSARYGSNGKLMGVMHFAYRRAILSGPTLHEISHYWANKFHFDESDTNGYRLGSGSHWGYNGFFGGKGQLGGYDATTLKNENATFTSKKGKEWRLYSAASFGWNANGGNGLPYNDVELYLMGMLSKEKVKDMMISKPWGSPTWPAANTYITENKLPTSGRKYFMAQEVVRKPWSDILAEHNVPERKPGVGTSQKHFRILTVLLDTKMPATYEINAISRQVQSLAYRGDDHNDRNYNFYEATRGVGSLSVSGLKDEVRGSSEEVVVEPAFVSQSLTWKGLTYKTVKSPYTGRVWLDRNLGATRVCESFEDSECYGGLFAFGRGMDGHEKLNSPIIQERLDTLTPNSNMFVVVGGTTTRVDWLKAGVDDDLSKRQAFLSDSSGNGMCPAGFRLPTMDELSAETNKNEVRDPFPGDQIEQNFLKLPMNGTRLSQTNRTAFFGFGKQGSYWTSTVSDGTVGHMLFGEDVIITYPTRYFSNGEGVRCIKN